MSASWNDYGFVVGMPTMAPGHKLSEVELLKWLNAYQWDAIARMLGCATYEIVNDAGERLYPSLVDVELGFGPSHGPERFGEGATVRVKNRVGVYADRFVEGLFVLDDADVPTATLDGIAGRSELRAHAGAWAAMTNVFIARMAGNVKLKVFAPAGIADAPADVLTEQPEGVSDQRRVQATGVMNHVASHPEAVALAPRGTNRITYPIVAESDLNGAGLLYFARFVAIMNYCERRFLETCLETPVSLPLALCLSTEHRRVFYFANAEPSDTVEAAVTTHVLPPPDDPSGRPARMRTPFRLHTRVDLYRGSDKVLMASSQVRKAVNVPADSKDVLMEAERLLRAIA
jgi:probable biosynthetic protein (TIGR04098 family)